MHANEPTHKYIYKVTVKVGWGLFLAGRNSRRSNCSGSTRTPFWPRRAGSCPSRPWSFESDTEGQKTLPLLLLEPSSVLERATIQRQCSRSRINDCEPKKKCIVRCRDASGYEIDASPALMTMIKVDADLDRWVTVRMVSESHYERMSYGDDNFLCFSKFHFYRTVWFLKTHTLRFVGGFDLFDFPENLSFFLKAIFWVPWVKSSF